MRAERSKVEIEARIEAERVDSKRGGAVLQVTSCFLHSSTEVKDHRIKDFTTILFEVVLSMDGEVDKGYGAGRRELSEQVNASSLSVPSVPAASLATNHRETSSEAIRALDSRRRAALLRSVP